MLRAQNVSEQNQKHFLSPGHKISVRNKCCSRGQTGKHLCRQQSSFTVLLSRSKDFVCLFTATELRSCIAWFETTAGEPGNMYLLEMTMNLLLCGFRLFALYWTRYHTDLEQMMKKKIFVKMGTECWKLLVK